jgi:hypothetical protein
MNYRRVASFTGWLWIITFVTSIPARFWFYAPVLDHEGNYVTGAGTDAQTLIAIGAVLELLLIIANVGTAVVPYSIHKRVHEAGAVAYVTAPAWWSAPSSRSGSSACWPSPASARTR